MNEAEYQELWTPSENSLCSKFFGWNFWRTIGKESSSN